VPLLDTGDELARTGDGVRIPPELCPLLCGHCAKGLAGELSPRVRITGEDRCRDFVFLLIREEPVVPAAVSSPVPESPGLIFGPFRVPFTYRSSRDVRERKTLSR
jgi:hypothetical protein